MSTMRQMYAKGVPLEDLAHYVYLVYDDAAQLLYVGVSSDIGARFTWHHSSTPWWNDDLGFDLRGPLPRREALDLETELIWTLSPLYNQPSSADMKAFNRQIQPA